MADEQVQVKFGADVSGATAGGGELKGVLTGIQGAVAALNAQFKAMGGAAVAGFEQATAAGQATAVAVKETAVAVQEARESVEGFGKALLAAFAVKEVIDFARDMGETAEQVAHTATTFGLATGEVQQLKALASGAGVPFEALTTAMQRSDRALTTAREGSAKAGEAFKVLGINIHEPIGQVQLIQQELAGLANVQDIPTRIGLAMQLFGRNIQAVAPLIGLTKAQLDEINQATVAYGAVNDDAQAKGMALAEAINTQHIAMQGLGNTLTEALAPAFTQVVEAVNKLILGFVESYQSGGEAKSLMDTLAVSVKVVATAAIGLGEVFVFWFGAIRTLIDATGSVFNKWKDETVGDTKVVGDAFITLGKVIYDSLTNNIQQGAKDAESGWALIQKDADATRVKVMADAADMKGALAAVTQMMRTMQGMSDTAKGIWGGGGGDDKALKALIDQNAKSGGGGAPPDLSPGGRKQRQGQDPTAQAMSQDTDQWQHIADMAVAITGNADLNMLQAETNFWAQKLQKAKQGSDLWFAIIEKLNPLVVAEQNADVKAIIDGVDQQVAARRRILDEQQKITDELIKIIEDGVQRETEAHNRAVEAEKKAYQQFVSIVGPVVNTVTSGFVKMLEGAETFRSFMLNLGQQILNDFVSRVVNPMVEKWLWGEAEKVLASQQAQAILMALGLKDMALAIANDAKKAASTVTTAATGTATEAAASTAQKAINATTAFSGGVASMAAAPFPLDLTAPAFGAQMAALASAAGGFDIPSGINPLTQLHAQEMVLPAPLANSVREMTQGGGGGGSGGGIDLSGHSYTFNGVSGNPGDFKQMLAAHRDALMAQVHAAYKGNYVHRGIASPPFKA